MNSSTQETSDPDLRQELLTRREKLLEQYSVPFLEKLQKEGNERFADAQRARNSMGSHSHDFESMSQRFNGLLHELTENIKELHEASENLTGLSDNELIKLCDHADPEWFLNNRQRQYEKDAKIPFSRRGDIMTVMLELSAQLGVNVTIADDFCKAAPTERDTRGR